MLLQADGNAFRRAGNAWDKVGSFLDDRADDLATTLRKLPDVWESGCASAAAAAHCDGLRKELDSAYPPVLAIAQALTQHGNGLAELRAHAENLIDEARRASVIVSPDGSMTMEPGHANEWTGRAMSTLVRQMDELLNQAADLDTRTAKIIADNTAVAAGTPAARVDRTMVPSKGGDPAAVKQWWDSLSTAQRRYVLAEYPELIGGLDGVPIADRDVANRIMLDRQKDHLKNRRAELDTREALILAMGEQGRGQDLYPGQPNPAGAALAELDKIRAERGDIDGKLRGIDKIDSRLNASDKPRAYLVGFNTADDGRAIVAVGNPDTADNVMTYVPGTGAELSKIGGDIERTDWMAADATRVDPSKQTAVLVWMDYDAPDTIPGATYSDYAKAGGVDLNRFQDGLRQTHDGPQSRNVVMGHSYGSTVIGNSAFDKPIAADALVFVGSPGVDTNSASDLHGVKPGQVWATRADHDMIARVPDWDIVHGNDPTREDFGGRVFHSNPGDPDNEGATHSMYWDKDNDARRNMAYILTGQTDKVS